LAGFDVNRLHKYATSVILCLAFVTIGFVFHEHPPDPTGLPPQAAGYKLVFSDDFDHLHVSPSGKGRYTWYEGVWFNKQHAPLRNISAADTILSLKWVRGQEASDTSITTASRDMRHARSWRYGYFEARMRWNPVPGAWPAFWLIPVQDATGKNIYNGTKETGEIDIFEGLGNHPHTFYGTIHDWVNGRDNQSSPNHFELPHEVNFSEFHTYGLLWTPGQVTWYLDNRPLHSAKTAAVFDKQDFYIVLGMQEGVDWEYGKLSSVSAQEMVLQVDWVRVWQK
jgi:Glycosyl hydrolases family 16